MCTKYILLKAVTILVIQNGTMGTLMTDSSRDTTGIDRGGYLSDSPCVPGRVAAIQGTVWFWMSGQHLPLELTG